MLHGSTPRGTSFRTTKGKWADRNNKDGKYYFEDGRQVCVSLQSKRVQKKLESDITTSDGRTIIREKVRVKDYTDEYREFEKQKPEIWKDVAKAHEKGQINNNETKVSMWEANVPNEKRGHISDLTTDGKKKQKNLISRASARKEQGEKSNRVKVNKTEKAAGANNNLTEAKKKNSILEGKNSDRMGTKETEKSQMKTSLLDKKNTNGQKANKPEAARNKYSSNKKSSDNEIRR
jgi:hypothetical protein